MKHKNLTTPQATSNSCRRVRPSSVLTFVLAIGLCGFGTFKALTPAQPSDSSTVVEVVPPIGVVADRAELHGQHTTDSPYLLTKASPAPRVSTKLTPIQTLRVGQRVRADAPTDELDLQFGEDVVPSAWRKLTLTAPKQNGTTSDVVLLRPWEWIEQQQAKVGGQVYIAVPECGIDGNATVHQIESCPQIIAGGGRVVTGTFRHRVGSGFELTVAGETQPIRCTGNHPIWSETRHDFVRADSLQLGEQLRTTIGLTHVESSTPLPGETYVYNIEVHGLHVYHVGQSGLLVHNSGDCLKKFYHGTDDLSAADIVENGLDGNAMAKINREFGELRDDLGFHMTEIRDGAEGAESYALSQAGNRNGLASIVEANWDDLKPFLRPRKDRPGEWYIPDDLFELLPSGLFRLSPGSPFNP